MDSTSTRSVTFIDGHVADIDVLIAGLEPGGTWFILDANQDGLAQMAAILANFRDLDAIHVLSHGTEGSLQLGSGWVDAHNLGGYADELQAVGRALNESGDLLFYGCNLAGGELGQAFIERIGDLTGADVAASTDLTGTQALGGDWTLEFATGALEASSLSPSGYQALLATVDGDAGANSLSGSTGNDLLRGLAGDDTLNGALGNDTLDGGTGSDRAVFSGIYASNAVAKPAGVLQVVGAEGTDVLFGVETLVFSDATVQLTLAAGNAIREVRVNTTTSNDQSAPSIAKLNDGGWVVAWTSNLQDGSSTGVYAQRYSAAGTTVGDEFLVNGEYTQDAQFNVSVASLVDGGWVIVWQSYGPDGLGTSIHGQRHDAAGALVGGEFEANETAVGDQTSPSVTGLSDGGWLVSWVSPDASGAGVYGQRYDSAGLEVGTQEFLVNTTTANEQSEPVVVGLGTGWLVVWQSLLQDSSGWGIYSQRYDATGTKLGSETLVNTYTSSDQGNPAVTVLADGGWLVTWHSYGQDGQGYGIYSQRYTSAGAASGSETRANVYLANDQLYPAVAALADGGWVVVWQSDVKDGSGYGIFSKRFTSAGTANGTEFQVNTTTAGAQSNPVVAGLADGGWVVSWQSAGQDGSGSGIYSQRYDATGAALLDGLVLNIVGDGSAQTLTGGVGNDTLAGMGGSDSLVGGLGADSMLGGTGDDSYVVDNTGDIIVELSGEGVDHVNSSVSIVLPAHVDHATLTGVGSTHVLGNALNNQLTGNAGANLLNGAGGADTMTGGAGHDRYFVDSPDDMVTEQAGQGFDRVFSSASHQLSGHVELLTLTGNATATATGNTLNNLLVGNSGNNTLTGGLGDDTVYGGAGQDTAVYGGTYASYAWDSSTGVLRLTGSGESETVLGVETLVFADATVQLQAGGALVGDVLASTTLGFDQRHPTLAVLADGGWVLAWQSSGQDGSDQGVYGQRYDAGGAKLGAEFKANSYTANLQEYVQAAALADGGWVLTWHSAGQDGSAYGVYQQRYDAAGAAVGVEQRVNSTTTDYQAVPAVAGLPTGGWVVVWHGVGSAAAGNQIYMQRYDAAGAALGGETMVNTSVSFDHYIEHVATLEDGGWVVAWQSFAQDGSDYGVYAQRFDAVGATVGAEFRVNASTAGAQWMTSTGGGALVGLADGGWVVVWSSAHAGNNDIYSQRYDATGLAVGGEQRVNTYLSGEQERATVAALSDGGWVVVWDSLGQDAAGYEVYGQRFDAAGQAVGGEFRANAQVAGNQANPTIEGLPDGGWLVTWNGDGNAGLDIYSRRFDENGVALPDGYTVDITGNGTAQTLTGGAGNDTLDGMGGVDNMVGGDGDDSYRVDQTGDIIVELSNQGTDSVTSSATYTLPFNVEQLTLTGTAAISATGNGLDNLLSGNSGNNQLIAGAGNDTLVGGAGVDSMSGGAGDDIFEVDNSGDVVLELANEGVDLVRSSVSFGLGETLENLVLTGSANISGAGGTGNNRLTGNSGNNTLTGGAGSDTLDGLSGNDSLAGGEGDDLYLWNPGQSVTLTINDSGGTADVLRVEVTGYTYTAEADGNNLVLKAYEVGNLVSTATLVNQFGAGRIESFVLGPEGSTVEFNLIEGNTGTAEPDWLFGTTGDDFMEGGASDDQLSGGRGNDTLDGGTGADLMVGGAGNDVYFVDDAGDLVSELNNIADTGGPQGIPLEIYAGVLDTVKTTINFTLGAYLENLILQGLGDLAGVGNGLRNELLGNDGANLLQGLAAFDTLAGGGGTDTLEGGTGDDVLDGGTGADSLAGGAGSDLYFVDDLSDTVVELDNTPVLDGPQGWGLPIYAGVEDTVSATVSFTLGDYVENLILAGLSGLSGGGNELRNDMLGNDGANLLQGFGDADTLNGGLGDDTLDGGAGNDSLVGGGGNDVARFAGNQADYSMVFDSLNGRYFVSSAAEGNDTVSGVESLQFADATVTIEGAATAINYAGTSANDSILGGAANDSLGGAAGNDTIDGGAGDDTMNGGIGGIDTASYASATAGVIASLSDREASGGAGNDQVVGFENLIGSAFNDLLTGSTVGNKLEGGAGNDTLNGGAGADTMEGGDGSDQYTVDSDLDVVTETNADSVTGGVDTVLTGLASYTLGANIENLRLTSDAAANGFGNSLNNLIIAGDGSNSLDGATGNDTVSYASTGAGVTASLTSKTATGGSGADELIAFENLIGSNYNDLLTGNTQANKLEGAGGGDTLNGGSGADTMTGGSGTDLFHVDNAGDVVIETGSDAPSGKDTVWSSVSYSLATSANVENLRITAAGAANATGNELNNILYSGAGDNILDGAGGVDIASYSYTSGPVNVSLAIQGTGQNTGAGGFDTLIGIENLTGSNYNDTLAGDAYDNLIEGGVGTDTVSFAAATGSINASLSSLSATGQGNDVLRRIENLIGSSQADTLTGSTIGNQLSGGDGNDLLTGKAGADTLTGGLGADIFDLNSAGESKATARDVITDFNAIEGDKIDLSTLDANTGTSGNQAFTVLDSGASFTGSTFTSGGKLFFDTTSHILYGNTDADADAEFAIELLGVASLTLSDILA